MFSEGNGNDPTGFGIQDSNGEIGTPGGSPPVSVVDKDTEQAQPLVDNKIIDQIDQSTPQRRSERIAGQAQDNRDNAENLKSQRTELENRAREIEERLEELERAGKSGSDEAANLNAELGFIDTDRKKIDEEKSFSERTAGNLDKKRVKAERLERFTDKTKSAVVQKYNSVGEHAKRTIEDVKSKGSELKNRGIESVNSAKAKGGEIYQNTVTKAGETIREGKKTVERGAEIVSTFGKEVHREVVEAVRVRELRKLHAETKANVESDESILKFVKDLESRERTIISDLTENGDARRAIDKALEAKLAKNMGDSEAEGQLEALEAERDALRDELGKIRDEITRITESHGTSEDIQERINRDKETLDSINLPDKGPGMFERFKGIISEKAAALVEKIKASFKTEGEKEALAKEAEELKDKQAEEAEDVVREQEETEAAQAEDQQEARDNFAKRIAKKIDLTKLRKNWGKILACVAVGAIGAGILPGAFSLFGGGGKEKRNPGVDQVINPSTRTEQTLEPGTHRTESLENKVDKATVEGAIVDARDNHGYNSTINTETLDSYHLRQIARAILDAQQKIARGIVGPEYMIHVLTIAENIPGDGTLEGGYSFDGIPREQMPAFIQRVEDAKAKGVGMPEIIQIAANHNIDLPKALDEAELGRIALETAMGIQASMNGSY